MTLYSYQISEELPSTLTLAVVLGVSQAETSHAATRLGAQPLALAFVSTSAASMPGNTVGWIRSVASASVVTSARVSAHLTAKALALASASAAGLARGIAPDTLALTATEALSLAKLRFRGVVVATTQGNVARRINTIIRILRAGALTNIASIVRGTGRALNLTGPETAAVAKGPGLLRGVAGPNAAALAKSAGKVFGTVTAAVQFRLAASGKLARAVSAQSTAIVRAFPLDLFAVSPEAVGSPFGGHFFFRSLGAPSPESTLVQRGMATHLGAGGPSAASVQKGPLKLLAVPSASVTLLLKQAGKILSALSSIAALTVRSAGKPFATVAPSVVLLQMSAALVGRVFHAVNAQIAALFAMRGKAQANAASEGQTASVVRNPLLAIPRALAVAQAQVLAVPRGIAKAVAATTSAVQASARSIVHLIAVQAGSSIALVARRSGLLAFAVQSSQVVGLVRTFLWARSVTSPEVTVAIVQRGKTVVVLSPIQSGLRRLVNKLVALLAPQVVASGKNVGAQFLHAVSPNVALMLTPRGFFMRTVQAQATRAVTWYHLFVSEWAYQQTILLPPAGGLAEPPSFGAIDPMDQTTFAFNWAARGNLNDPIVSATVVSVPPGLGFFGPPFITGSLVEVTVAPFNPTTLPVTYSLRCTAVFASGRRSSFSIPLPVQTL